MVFKRNIPLGVILGGGLLVGSALMIQQVVRPQPSEHRLSFVGSSLVLTQGWSVESLHRTRAFNFLPPTDTLTLFGPDRLRVHLAYTPSEPPANFGWIPLTPHSALLHPNPPRNSKVIGIPTRSPYVAAFWTVGPDHQVIFKSMEQTPQGIYEWASNSIPRSKQGALLRLYRHWHLPPPFTYTQAVHTLMTTERYLKRRIIQATLGPREWFLASGIPQAGSTPQYLFYTNDHGRHWSLIYVNLDEPPWNIFPTSDLGLIALRFVTPQDGWMVQSVTLGDGGRMTLYATRDGGRQWQAVSHRILPASELISALSILQVDGHRAEITVKTSLRQGHHWTQRWSIQWMVINP